MLGRINSGQIKVNDKIQALDGNGKIIEINKVFKIIRRYGMSQVLLWSVPKKLITKLD